MTENSYSFSSNHPPLPPTTEEARLAWLRLLRSRRVGPTTFWRLLSEHGSAQAALAELPAIAAAAGVSDYHTCPEGVVLAEIKAARLYGARAVFSGEPGYPALLTDIPDAPPMLWVAGDVAALTRPSVALVGARNASSLGGRMAKSLAKELGKEGFVVVSGLARGIDTAAHQAALEGGTVAVMAGGVDILYPSENTRLAQDIRNNGGALISEQPMGMQPHARHFPARNRIVSGMSAATVVVEAAVKSGSLITARAALDQGREVLAVPGHPFDARAGGCNMLIRDGARLVRGAEDVIEAVGTAVQPMQADLDLPIIPAPPPEQRSLRETATLHGAILSRLGPSPVPEDQLIRDLGASSGEVTPLLTDLELDGHIQRRPGGMLTRI